MAGDFNLFLNAKLLADGENSTQIHSSGFIQRRLDYILLSNTLQKFVTRTEILTPIPTNHYPVLFSLSKETTSIRGKGFWKLIVL